MAPEHDPNSTQNIAAAIAEVSDRAQKLIKEEVELAKAEVTAKVTSLAKGIVIGIAAGIFIVIGLLFLLHGAAWAFYDYLFEDVSWGYFIVAAILFVLGGLAGFLAAKALKFGAPPVPVKAIEEAKLIKETVDAAREGQPAPVPVAEVKP